MQRDHPYSSVGNGDESLNVEQVSNSGQRSRKAPCFCGIPHSFKENEEACCSDSSLCRGSNLLIGPVETNDTIGWSEAICGDCWYGWQEVWVLVDLVEATDQQLEPVSIGPVPAAEYTAPERKRVGQGQSDPPTSDKCRQGEGALARQPTELLLRWEQLNMSAPYYGAATSLQKRASG